MTFTSQLPLCAGTLLQLSIEAGSTLFVVGANGTGKSSLMQRLYSDHRAAARRISAHRQTWFSSNAITLSPQDKRNTEIQVRNQDSNPQSRWRDDYSASRPSMAIYDLIDAENVRSRSIAASVDSNDIETAKLLSKKDAPLKSINELLRLSNLPIEVSVHQNEQVMASRNGGQRYSVAELSDGERNALLIAAEVLTAPPGTLLLIDEPERHLHRSIISPLLTLLFRKRDDCSFVVSTHDIELPLDNHGARVLLTRDCLYTNGSITAWDLDLLPDAQSIPDDLKRDVLGGRRQIIFVEGDSRSMDLPLYALLFPATTIVPKESCREVINSVKGIRSAAPLHWVSAFGVIDNDRRSAENIAELATEGVYALAVFSVESIYYDTEFMRRISERASHLTGIDPPTLLRAATTAALEAIAPHAQRLAERATERQLRDEIESQLPTRQSISSGTAYSISIDVATRVAQEAERLRQTLAANDLRSLIARYPIRETPALNEIAKKLGFQTRAQYESAVRKMLLDEPSARLFARSLFGQLEAELPSWADSVTPNPSCMDSPVNR